MLTRCFAGIHSLHPCSSPFGQLTLCKMAFLPFCPQLAFALLRRTLFDGLRLKRVGHRSCTSCARGISASLHVIARHLFRESTALAGEAFFVFAYKFKSKINLSSSIYAVIYLKGYCVVLILLPFIS